MNKFLQGLLNEGISPYIKTLSTELIPTSTQVEREIDSIEETIFIGYPSGFFDRANLLPIVRRGITEAGH